MGWITYVIGLISNLSNKVVSPNFGLLLLCFYKEQYLLGRSGCGIDNEEDSVRVRLTVTLIFLRSPSVFLSCTRLVSLRTRV